jgi:hypothetical protein
MELVGLDLGLRAPWDEPVCSATGPIVRCVQDIKESDVAILLSTCLKYDHRSDGSAPGSVLSPQLRIDTASSEKLSEHSGGAALQAWMWREL